MRRLDMIRISDVTIGKGEVKARQEKEKARCAEKGNGIYLNRIGLKRLEKDEGRRAMIRKETVEYRTESS